jgi:thiamine biosynthesis lipoprotein
MGTTWMLRAFVPAAFSAASLEADIVALLDDITAQMSHWTPGATINRFNDLPASAWLELPARFQTVLDCALQIAEQTNGAFDPTIGALVDLWGFGAVAPPEEVPGDAALGEALAATGWRKLARTGNRLRQPGGVRLDFNGIAKGYAVDEVAALAARAGLASYLVEIGGELFGAGVKPDGQPWWVEAEQPGAAERTLAALYNTAIATSGDYRRTAMLGGEAISHTLAPENGRPIVNRVAAVSVLHASCMHADGYATALQVLGPERGLAFADQHGLAALILQRADGAPTEHITRAARDMLS